VAILIATFGLMFFSTSHARAERWTKNASQTSGCTSTGFSSVNRVDNNPIIGETTHTMTCSGCGNLSCEWLLHPDYGDDPNVIGRTIDSRVAAGSYSGSEVTTINGQIWYYTWTFITSTGVLDVAIWK